MRILHFGDLHVWQLQVEWNDPFYPKRFLGGANLLLNRRKRFPPALGQAVLHQIAQEEADLVVFSGDLTTTALRAEFALAQSLLAPLQEKWGERFFILPGNHDRYPPALFAISSTNAFFPPVPSTPPPPVASKISTTPGP